MRDFDPVSKNRHRRNRGDAKTLGQNQQLLSVDLGHENLTSDFVRDFAYFRRHHFAGTAPWRPKIDQHWQSRPADQRVENKIAMHVRRFTGRSQFPLAPTHRKTLPSPSYFKRLRRPHFGQVIKIPLSSVSILLMTTTNAV
jgi:hypothetical protein